MGLIDRDYMHEKRRQRPFSPPPERFKLGTLGMALVFVMALFFLYKAADWLLNHRAVQHVSQPAAAPAPRFAPSTLPARALPAQPAYQNRPDTTAGASRVSKCVANGKTSYGDGSCAQGSIGSQITTRADHNLIASVRPQTHALTLGEAPAIRAVVEVQSISLDDAAVKKAECQSLEAQIERWDSMARQPQGAQMQDWIRDQRKKARDRQFQIHCG